MTRKERDEVLVAARARTGIGEDVEKRTADLSVPSHRNVVEDVHELAAAVAGLGRAVEKLARG